MRCWELLPIFSEKIGLRAYSVLIITFNDILEHLIFQVSYSDLMIIEVLLEYFLPSIHLILYLEHVVKRPLSICLECQMDVLHRF